MIWRGGRRSEARSDSGNAVLIVGTRAPTVGGISSVVEDHITGLSDLGWSVETVNTGSRLRRRPGRASVENVVASLSAIIAVFRSALRSRPSVAAIHGVGSPLLPLARLTALVVAARMAGSPTVVHLHAYDLEQSLKNSGFRWGMRLLDRVANQIVVLHASLADQVGAAAGRRPAVLPNSIDTEAFQPRRQRSERPPDCLRVLFVGTVGKRKGVPELVQAARGSHAALRVTIVGGAGEEGVDVNNQVQADAADLVRSGRVTFIGEVDRAEVRALMASADLFVLPSHGEGLPVALLEAMASGLPSVVSDVGAMPAMVTPVGAGLVVAPGDVAALASAIDLAAADVSWRAAAGRRARESIEGTYARPAVMSELSTLYRSVRSTAGRRR